MTQASRANRLVWNPVRPPNAPRPAPERDNLLSDLRFRTLIDDDDWHRLPPAVRRRFTQRLAGGNTIVYAGEVIETRLSRAGWWLAQIARLVGGPLPLSAEARVPSVVTVTEDMAKGKQVWTRLYARRSGFPQVIHSSKRFAGPTGLEEYVGYGVGMALTVHMVDHASVQGPEQACPGLDPGACPALDAGWKPVVAKGSCSTEVPQRKDEWRRGRPALMFRSAHYFLQVFGVRVKLPGWLTPGRLSVTHAETGEGTFTYTLELVHPRFGPIIRQTAIFRETTLCVPPSCG